MIKPVGMRTLKTALAVIVSIEISRLLILDNAFYAPIAAVISMQSSITDSFKTGINRMLGTFIGALIGLIFALISPNNLLLIGIGVIIVIYLCNVFHWEKAVSIACIVFISIMTNLKGKSPFYYSINRLFDTFIGISIAVLINSIFFPPKHEKKIEEAYNTVIDELLTCTSDSILYNKKLKLSSLKSNIDLLHSLLRTYENEIDINKKLSTINHALNNFDKIVKSYEELNAILNLQYDSSLNEDNLSRLSKLFNIKSINVIEYKNTDINIIYNYHISNLIDLLDDISLNKKLNI